MTKTRIRNTLGACAWRRAPNLLPNPDRLKGTLALLLLAMCAWSRGLAQTIAQSPSDQIATRGGGATFSVIVSGGGPFRYQWQCNGTNLPNGNIITTIAGNGGEFSGEGGPATNAGIGLTQGLALDGVGNVFFADSSDNRILVVRTNGIMYDVAGNGPNASSYGSYGGDGGPATNASLWGPSGVALDRAGNVYISEVNNHRVRKVDANGIITTVAGDGEWSVSGDGGAATNAAVGGPWAVSFDPLGNLYIADAENSYIRKIDTNGIISTIAGKAGAGFAGDGGPVTNASFNFNYGAGFAFDSAGDLFVADAWNNRIRKVDNSGIVTTVAGDGTWGFSGDGGPATDAGLNLPANMAIDCDGNVFIADQYNNRIRQVDTNGFITTIAGSGPLFNGSYSGDGGSATNATLNEPEDVALDSVGNLFISDSYNGRIRKVAFAGSPVLTLSNVSLSNAGQYRVIVTGASGSVTSSVATLFVNWPALISKVARNTDGSLTLNCSSAPDSTNLLLTATKLLSPAPWQVLSTNIAGSDGTWQYTDTNAAGLSARFYRVLTR